MELSELVPGVTDATMLDCALVVVKNSGVSVNALVDMSGAVVVATDDMPLGIFVGGKLGASLGIVLGAWDAASVETV